MVWPRWRIKTLMVVVAATAGLLALARVLDAFSLVALIVLSSLFAVGFLQPSIPIRFREWSCLCVALFWASPVFLALIADLDREGVLRVSLLPIAVIVLGRAARAVVDTRSRIKLISGTND